MLVQGYIECGVFTTKNHCILQNPTENNYCVWCQSQSACITYNACNELYNGQPLQDLNCTDIETNVHVLDCSHADTIVAWIGLAYALLVGGIFIVVGGILIVMALCLGCCKIFSYCEQAFDCIVRLKHSRRRQDYNEIEQVMTEL